MASLTNSSTEKEALSEPDVDKANQLNEPVGLWTWDALVGSVQCTSGNTIIIVIMWNVIA